MENRSATLDLLLAELNGLTGYSDPHVVRLARLLELSSTGPAEAPRDQTRRLRLWRRMLQDIPVDERSFDDRFGIASRTDVIDVLTRWCLGYPAQSDDRRAALSGLFGFASLFLLTLLSLAESEAQRSNSHTSAVPDGGDRALTHDCEGTCRVLVAEAAVAEAIAGVYSPQSLPGRRHPAWPAEPEWRAVQREALRFHRHGSTSVILRGTTATSVHGTRPQFALKLILYPFTKIRTIAQATREYAARYDTSAFDSRHLVRVWASYDSWILMDFVEGRTLAETVREESVVEANGAGDFRRLRLDRLEEKGVLLFDALDELQRIARDNRSRDQFTGVHADLSPSNIIVSDGDGTFKLIDLGRNYLYTHTITGTTGVDYSYIAPEVKAGGNEIARADLYSLGQLLILIGCGRTSTDSVVPDIFYMRAMLLARFIEDLIDADPARRLLIFDTAAGPDFSFGRLKSVFLAELEMVRAAEGGSTELRVRSGWRALGELLRPLAGDPGREWRLWRMRRRQSAHHIPNRALFTHWLLAWSFIAAVIWTITNSVVITWLLRDLDLSWGNRLVELVQHLSHDPTGLPVVDTWRHGDYRLPDWKANLPERLVGFSYALAAPKYYEMLFSGLTPLVLGRRSGATSWLALAAEAVMRMMAVVPCGLVLAATLIEPRWWPINSALGQTVLCAANYLALAFIRAVIARSRKLGLSTVPGDDSKITGLSSFAQWAPTSLFYAVVVWTIGILIYLRLLHDVYVYALAVTATNIFLFYVIKCGIGGPMIRVAMVRTCLAAERVGRCR
ncbi:hypothetical protein [Actinacidiphila sp. ITFR-21]|uniref:hypothetical protein n=1 Tax=Actinacidiphila sp. ITFR-21 TaxID=3075199 RepID=UPI00288C56E5|nr:hypothetical protein [Streptomyces sp. ITFR-21]WNI18773.1 hypothetical protein RLT57_26775 [Streptomyces sp. ITFR-21]